MIMTMNITPSERLSHIREYYFSRKLAEVARLRASGRDIISLGIGGPDRPPHPQVISTLVDEARRDDTHGYQLTKGVPELRRAWSRFYNEHYGVTLDADSEILPLIGSKEGILHVLLAFTNPGDEVLVPDPGYPTYTSASHLAGVTPVAYDLLAENGWYPDFARLESIDLSRVRIMWVNYPHMPTGTLASIEVFEKILDFGRRHDILIVNDNPYSFILNDTPISILSLPGAKEVAIEMNSLSKSHNMAGWRMAVIASNPTFIEWILRVKSNVDSGQYLPMMKGATEALGAGDDWYKGLNEVYARRRLIAEEIMTAAGCTFDGSQRGMFLWGKVNDTIEDVETLTDRILYEGGVFITPGFIFGRNGERYVRISLCATEENLYEALNRIKSLKLTEK